VYRIFVYLFKHAMQFVFQQQTGYITWTSSNDYIYV